MRIGLVGAGRIGSIHAANLFALDTVDEVVIADADPARARVLAGRDAAGVAVGSPGELLAAGLDALVIASATDSHPELILAGLDAGLPTFCEKPVAGDLASTRAIIEKVASSAVPVQIGFQRRHDAGYLIAREAVRSGALGRVHTVRAGTLDAAPPPAAYVPTSGGIFRDCSVHDFDVVRWVTGQEIVEVYALGANRGAAFFGEAGDVDSAAMLLTLSDDTFAHVMCSRYNAAGYDVRMELLGSDAGIVVGLDERAPLRSAEVATSFPTGVPYGSFLERFGRAYLAEMAAFVDVAAGRGAASCTVEDALAAFLVAEACELSRREHRPVALSELG